MQRSFVVVSALTISTFCLARVAGAAQSAPGQVPVGAVYVATNDPAGNEVVAFTRLANGELLSAPTRFSTRGQGSGGPLGNQGGLALTEDERFLLAVNARSDDVTVFLVQADGLEVRELEPTGGQRPISIATHDNWVYVLNGGGLAGGIDQIAGFQLTAFGTLLPLAGSVQHLSAPSTDPAQISFSPDGSFLVVTEKMTNKVTVFAVSSDGIAAAPHSQPSAGPTPFGFGFGVRDQLFVSEAFGGRTDSSAVSSYVISGTGRFRVIDASAPTTETAACWIAVTPGGRFVYASNTGSDSITGYAVSFDGGLSLLDQNGITAKTGDKPIDLDLSNDGQFLYVLGSGDGSITAMRVDLENGDLHKIDEEDQLPLSANGLVAR